jgi:hypothetical protein
MLSADDGAKPIRRIGREGEPGNPPGDAPMTNIPRLSW